MLRFLAEQFRRIVSLPELNDPIFGVIHFKERLWSGKAALPGMPDPVMVDIFAGPDGPTEGQRRISREMLEQFKELRAAMEKPLFIEYQAIRSGAQALIDPSMSELTEDFAIEFPEIGSPSNIWDVATLHRVEVYDRPDIDFCFDHKMMWGDEDHQLNVLVKDLAVLEIAYEG